MRDLVDIFRQNTLSLDLDDCPINPYRYTSDTPTSGHEAAHQDAREAAHDAAGLHVVNPFSGIVAASEG